ncbi:hypothetical protein BG011_003255, partial [Mortierella polycephala]
LDTIAPRTAPLVKKTIKFTLTLDVIPEDTDISDDEEAPEPEQNNNTVDVAPSNVDSAIPPITENRESAPDSSSPTNLSAAANFDVVRRTPRGSTREMRPRPSTQESSRRFTPLGFRPPMLRRSSAVKSFDLFEDTADEVAGTDLGKDLDVVVGNDLDKVSDDEQTARKTEQALATIDRPQKHALAMDDTRDTKRVARIVGTSRAREEDAVTVVVD